MDAIGMVLVVIGYIICFIGGVWLIVVAFQDSILWGVLCLLCGPASLVFVIMHWNEAKKPFLIQLAGLVPLLIGTVMTGQK